MVMGSNVSLPALSEHTGSVIVSLGWASATGEGDADVSVLLLGAGGKVRGDDDFFFYNHPVAADGSVQLLGKAPTADGDEDRISFDLTAVPQDVTRIVIAASRYNGARFGELQGVRLTLADATGEELLHFAIGDADAVSAVIFGELYRRGDQWKFRAVGQGYDSGLAGLATDFGVNVDDAPDEAAGDAFGALPAAPGTGAGAVPGGANGSVPRAAAGAAASAVPGAANGDGPERTPAAGTLTRSELTIHQAGLTSAAAAWRPATVLPAQRAESTPEEPGQGTTSEQQTQPSRPAPRPRTAKKKITLPKATAHNPLAENDAWREARLFPVSALRSDHDRETRATSVLLSVMAQVPELGRRLTAAFGAPAGRMATFTEVVLRHGESPRRPDGVIRVERAGKLWTALVETKTNGNALKADQVQAYMDIAARRGYEAVITLSNDVALEGSPLVNVTVDHRRKNKVALWHLSWAEVTHHAQLLIRHEGVGNAAHAWLLGELLHYLQHENSGCHGFQNMGPAWVPVRNGIDDETLCQGDRRALAVVENWERLVRQVCFTLGGELGQKVLPVQRAKRGADPGERRSLLADQLCTDGRLTAEMRIEGVPGVLALTADLRTSRLRTSIQVAAPEHGYPLTWAKRLVKRLADAPADVHVETLLDGGSGGPRGTLERLRREPADLLPQDSAAHITGFRLSLIKGMGSGRGNAQSGFIRSVDDAVQRFYTTVVVPLDHPAPLDRPPLRRTAAPKESTA